MSRGREAAAAASSTEVSGVVERRCQREAATAAAMLFLCPSVRR
jgi:hypothetical protein